MQTCVLMVLATGKQSSLMDFQWSMLPQIREEDRVECWAVSAGRHCIHGDVHMTLSPCLSCPPVKFFVLTDHDKS